MKELPLTVRLVSAFVVTFAVLVNGGPTIVGDDRVDVLVIDIYVHCNVRNLESGLALVRALEIDANQYD